MVSDAVIKPWVKAGKIAFVGRKIADFRYMTDAEQAAHGWYCRAPVLVLDDGHLVYPSADDEGNGPGALFTTYDNLSTVPVC